ncbi:hypothetical protein Trydic_g6465 [Trypoxylus dichotomus]
MVQFVGKYQLERNENFIEFVQSLGQNLSPEMIEKLNSTKSIFEVAQDGDKYTFISHSGTSRPMTFKLGEEFAEETLGGLKLKTTAKQEGDKIVLSAVGGSQSGSRIYEFTKDGLITSFTAGDIVGKRYYKRL